MADSSRCSQGMRNRMLSQTTDHQHTARRDIQLPVTECRPTGRPISRRRTLRRNRGKPTMASKADSKAETDVWRVGLRKENVLLATGSIINAHKGCSIRTRRAAFFRGSQAGGGMTERAGPWREIGRRGENRQHRAAYAADRPDHTHNEADRPLWAACFSASLASHLLSRPACACHLRGQRHGRSRYFESSVPNAHVGTFA